MNRGMPEADLVAAALAGTLPAAIELRHGLHRRPGISGAEQETLSRLLEHLGPQATSVRQLAGGAVLRFGAQQGPSIAIRAEMDALPIQETTGLPWSSQIPGASHACGHDVHMAAAVAAVGAIARLGLPVPVVLALQPREETYPSGALDLLAEGALDGHQVAAMLGIHVQPLLAAGSVSVAGGVINAASDHFELIIHGRPAHGAYPHLGRDPVLAVAAVIQAVQQLVSRRIDPMRPAVVTIGQINGGEAPNQIPGSVRIAGTLRSYEVPDRDLLHNELQVISEAVCAAHGCRAELRIHPGEPVLRNDDELAPLVAAALEGAGFERAVPLRSCGADDFSYYAERVPSLMMFAGVGQGEGGSPGLHHPGFAPADEAVADLAQILVRSYLAIAHHLMNPTPPATAEGQ